MYTVQKGININKIRSGFFLLFFLGISIVSCEEKKEDLTSDFSSAVYDVPSDKLWAHRINTPQLAIEWLKQYSGIELDIVYEEELKRFNVRHDLDRPSSSYYLSDFIDSLDRLDSVYFWFDLKNLNWNNASEMSELLDQLLIDKKIKNRCIVESYNSKELFEFNKRGLRTSYWIPHLYGSATKEDSIKCIETIKEVLENYSCNALSAHYNMYAYVNEYFPNSNYHLWTNGLITEKDKEKIKDLHSKPNIKVILVDYEVNFMKH